MKKRKDTNKKRKSAVPKAADFEQYEFTVTAAVYFLGKSDPVIIPMTLPRASSAALMLGIGGAAYNAIKAHNPHTQMWRFEVLTVQHANDEVWTIEDFANPERAQIFVNNYPIRKRA